MTPWERNAKRLFKSVVWTGIIIGIVLLTGNKYDFGMVMITVAAVVVSDVLDGLLPTAESRK